MNDDAAHLLVHLNYDPSSHSLEGTSISGDIRLKNDRLQLDWEEKVSIAPEPSPIGELLP